MSDIVNVYPQAINRDCCDKNHQSGPAKHWDTQIISQPGWVSPRPIFALFQFQITNFWDFNLTPDSTIR
jgi:hypothetical protein